MVEMQTSIVIGGEMSHMGWVRVRAGDEHYVIVPLFWITLLSDCINIMSLFRSVRHFSMIVFLLILVMWAAEMTAARLIQRTCVCVCVCVCVCDIEVRLRQGFNIQLRYSVVCLPLLIMSRSSRPLQKPVWTLPFPAALMSFSYLPI